MGSIFANNVLCHVRRGNVCKAFGIRLVTNTQIVQLARNAGFDALFIELEHSNITLHEASQLSIAGLHAGITPFVRVPHECGNGFVQRVLDGGAMGVIFPHIHSAKDAEAAVSISKYPPFGKRSMTGQLPQFSLKPIPTQTVIEEANAYGSSVVLMIETRESIDRIEEIAAVEGADILLIGANDLSIELGVPGQFKSDSFRNAARAVRDACLRYGKILGFAGIYEDKEMQSWVINELGARYILGQQDSGLIARSASECVAALSSIQK